MVYIVVNFLVGAALMTFAFISEHVSNAQKEEPSMTNQILMLSFICILMGLLNLLIYFAPRPLCLLIGRGIYVLVGWFCTGFCKAIFTYKSKKKKHYFLTIVQWVINVLAFGVVFLSGKCITGISLDEGSVLRIASANLIEGAFGRMINISWIDAYMFFFVGIFQFVTVLMVLIKAEYLKDKLLKQNMIVFSLGTLVTWIVAILLFFGIAYQPALSNLTILVLVPELLINVYSSSNTTVWGKKLVGRTILRLIILYLIPSIIIGGGFFVLYKNFPNKGVPFYILSVALSGGVFTAWLFIFKYISKTDLMRDGRYAEEFESVVTSLNFEDQAGNVGKSLEEAFKKYVEASSVRIAIDAGTGFLETIDDESESSKIMVPINQKGFDILLNIKHSVVLKSFVKTNYQMKEAKDSILKMMDETNSEAFILLNEGRRIIGAIFLGPKVSSDSYNKYDYDIFTKLYSTFFVVGYYMKNMMNESVVGTVNREIRMSSQIITSIQENMDYINNEKVDCGYRMVPAHNIGGEFIDMIRLNDTRHMFVIGALSGKGIAASMSMVILKSVIRTNLAETKDFKVLIEKINSFIRTGLPKGTFFSGLFGIIDFSTDTLYYINCGAPALFMYNHLYNNVIEIQGEGHVLGFMKDISNLIRVKKVKLTAGDIIFACTDGLIESKSLRGESYGKTRVQSQLMENASYPAEKMGQFMYENLLDFTTRALEDDFTELVIKQMK